MKLKRFFYLPLAVISTVAFTSCLNDDDGDAEIRNGFISVMNAMSDTSALDFYIDNTRLGEDPTPYTGAFPDESYEVIPSYQYTLSAYFPGEDNANNFLLRGNFNITQDIYHSVYVYNTSDSAKAILLTDDLASPASGMAKVRFLHLGTKAPAVDLGIEGETETWFNDIEFIDEPTEGLDDFEEFPSGTYILEVKDSATDEVLASTSVNLEDSKVYTLFLRGINEETGMKALGLQSVEHIEWEDPSAP